MYWRPMQWVPSPGKNISTARSDCINQNIIRPDLNCSGSQRATQTLATQTLMLILFSTCSIHLQTNKTKKPHLHFSSALLFTFPVYILTYRHFADPTLQVKTCRSSLRSVCILLIFNLSPPEYSSTYYRNENLKQWRQTDCQEVFCYPSSPVSITNIESLTAMLTAVRLYSEQWCIEFNPYVNMLLMTALACCLADMFTLCIIQFSICNMHFY